MKSPSSYKPVLTRRIEAVIGPEAWERIRAYVKAGTDDLRDADKLIRAYSAAKYHAGNETFTEASMLAAINEAWK